MKQKIMKRIAVAALSASMALSGSAGYVFASEAEETKTVVDSMENEVVIPAEIDSLAILPMPWISVVYALNGSGDIITGMQQVAKNSYNTSMLKVLAPELEDTNTSFFADGEFNFEELAKIDPDVMILFESQSKFIDKLNEVGIPAVTIKYADSFDTLWNDFSIIGDVLSKEERAQSFVDYQKEDIAYLESKADQLDKDNPVKVLQLYMSDLQVCDNSGTFNAAVNHAGGVNVAQTTLEASSEVQVNMEQILAWNPDVILLSNFDDMVPDDFYSNSFDGQDWSQVKAVQDHRVYKIPQGIYRWDADCPCTETTLCAKWMARVINPDIFDDFDLKQDVKDFYKDFFDYELSDEEIDTILAAEANADSVQLFD
ncbi:MAG: ABC transporter substrate-binding protein [Blautia sp.]|nr:ABC transporter substrate-binding protein [Blautia sp.]MDY3999963.1 ABC transporter substrate-binding protein [Blautia sp.]